MVRYLNNFKIIKIEKKVGILIVSYLYGFHDVRGREGIQNDAFCYRIDVWPRNKSISEENTVEDDGQEPQDQLDLDGM